MVLINTLGANKGLFCAQKTCGTANVIVRSRKPNTISAFCACEAGVLCQVLLLGDPPHSVREVVTQCACRITHPKKDPRKPRIDDVLVDHTGAPLCFILPSSSPPTEHWREDTSLPHPVTGSGHEASNVVSRRRLSLPLLAPVCEHRGRR